MTHVRYLCTICEAAQSPEQNWFLLVQNQWDDRIKVLQWNASLASQPGVHCACSTAHAKQLVAHWMATGSLDYPFASSNNSLKSGRRRLVSGPSASATADVSGAVQLGELAVHRESLRRVLEDNPHSLSSILDALVSGLERHQSPLSLRIAEEDVPSAELEVCFQ